MIHPGGRSLRLRRAEPSCGLHRRVHEPLIEAGELSLRAVIGGEGMPSNWKHLSQIPLFSNLCERRLRKLASKATEDAYETGDVILSEGGRTVAPPSRPGDRRFLERCGPREVVVECWTNREGVEMGRHLTRTKGPKGRRGIYVQEAPRGPAYKLAYRDGRGVVTSKRSIDRVAVPAAQPERSQSRRTWNRSSMKARCTPAFDAPPGGNDDRRVGGTRGSGLATIVRGSPGVVL